MIDGVKIINLTTHKDERGFFREIIRFSEQFDGIPVGQMSHSLVMEGVIKAWHGHVVQSQWNYVVCGQIKVGLYDNRKASATYKGMMEFFVGDLEKPIAYYFPPGVFHGYKCIESPMQIVYVTSGVYDIDDEIRLTNEDLNIDFTW